MNQTYFTIVHTPIGALRLVGDAGGCLSRIDFHAEALAPDPDWIEDPAPFSTAIAQLGEYFEGRRTRFELALAPAGTPFQRQVWELLRDIPYGVTTTYGELARRLNKPNGSRAVGLANGANPLPIVVPCHRVIGANGQLTGFGGGIDTKRALLRLEGALLV